MERRLPLCARSVTLKPFVKRDERLEIAVIAQLRKKPSEDFSSQHRKRSARSSCFVANAKAGGFAHFLEQLLVLFPGHVVKGDLRCGRQFRNERVWTQRLRAHDFLGFALDLTGFYRLLHTHTSGAASASRFEECFTGGE